MFYRVAITPKKSSEYKLEDSEETKNIVLTVYISIFQKSPFRNGRFLLDIFFIYA